MKEEIINELNDIAPILADLKSKNQINDVPIGYFDELQNQLSNEIRIEQIIKYKKSPVHIPENYFADLPEKVLSEIHFEDIKNSLNSYSDIPVNYFDDLTEKVLSNANQKQEVRIVSFYKKYKWIAAAAIFIGAVFTINKLELLNKETNTFVNNSTEQSYDEMLNELTEEDAALLIDQFSTEEDLQYIKTHEAITELNLNSNLESSLSDEELELELTEEDVEFLKTMM